MPTRPVPSAPGAPAPSPLAFPALIDRPIGARDRFSGSAAPDKRDPLAPHRRDPLAPVIRAAPADLAYVVALQKRNHEALGFIPRAALAEKIDRGRIWLATENGDPAGYLHHGSLAVPEVRVFQAAVQYDARRRHLGLALVADLLARARAASARGVSLRCLDFLDANDFWTAAGFHRLTTEPGARGTLNVWGRLLGRDGRDNETRGEGDKETHAGAPTSASVPLLSCPRVPLSSASPVPLSPSTSSFSFHSRIHPCPRCGVPTTDTWTRGAVRRRVCPRCV